MFLIFYLTAYHLLVKYLGITSYDCSGLDPLNLNRTRSSLSLLKAKQTLGGYVLVWCADLSQSIVLSENFNASSNTCVFQKQQKQYFCIIDLI